VSLGWFTQADSIIPDPGISQVWDRYTYVLNSPLRFTDPSGHYYYDLGCDCLVDNGVNVMQYKDYLYYVHKENPIDLRNSEQFIKKKENIAMGVRGEASGWIIKGLDINLDILYFFESNEIGIFVSQPGQTGIGGGRGLTLGILLGENMPDKSVYSGISVVEGGITIPVPNQIVPINVESDRTSSLSINPDGSIPTVKYYGAGPLTFETGVYQNPAYTIDVLDMMSQVLRKFFGK
jgi:hypothetical protein